EPRRGEAMEDDGSAEPLERPRRLLARRSRVDDHGLPELLRQDELPLEELELGVTRSVVPVEVEARLPHRDCALVAEELAKLRDACRVVAPGLVRVNPERRVHALVLVRQTERRASGVDPRTHGDDSRDARVAPAADEGRSSVRGGVEVRVRVDHASAPTGPEEPASWLCPRAGSCSETLVV